MYQPKYPISSDQNGFILITSLLFLVIITLLALSGIGSSTLQQKMTNNSNEKAASLQAANSTLANAESLIRKMRTAPPYPAKRIVCYDPNKGAIVNCGSGLIHLNINTDRMQRSPDSWLSKQQWQDWLTSKNKSVQTFQPKNGPKTTYRITVTTPQPSAKNNSPGRGLNPQATANQTTGIFLYKITAYAAGPSNKAPAVTQAVYRKGY